MKYIRGYTLLLIIYVLGLFNSGFSQVNSSTKIDSSYESYMDEAWDKIKNANDPKADSLQGIFSDKFFNYYLDHQNTKTGGKAFLNAFVMWGNIGKYKYVNEALETLGNDSPLWEKIISRVGRIYFQNEEIGGMDAYNKLLIDLENRLTHPKSRSQVLLQLLRAERKDNKGKAAKLARELVELDASNFYVDQGLGYLHELKSLNIDQKAPNFVAETLDGQKISITNLEGKYVLLDFWATWCGPCMPEIPHLKEIWNEHKDSNFLIVGISLDRNRRALANFLDERDIHWPQIIETDVWESDIAESYNVVGIPRTYLINPKGKIVAKDLRGEKMETEIEKYLNN